MNTILAILLALAIIGTVAFHLYDQRYINRLEYSITILTKQLVRKTTQLIEAWLAIEEEVNVRKGDMDSRCCSGYLVVNPDDIRPPGETAGEERNSCCDRSNNCSIKGW